MARHPGERAQFMRSFLSHPRRVGAVLPTSRHTVRDMLDLADVSAARRVVELGSGTGVYTREVLARLHRDADLLAFELDPDLADRVATELPDHRLRVIKDSAEKVEEYLHGKPADIVVSGIPFTSLPAGQRRNILESARQALRPGGVMLVLQYSPLIQPELSRVFPSVRRQLSPLNVPPAFLFACGTTPTPNPEGAQ